MIPFFPVIELVDRLCIAELKFSKTGLNQSELDFYKNQLSNYDLSLIKNDLVQLIAIHTDIWNLESELKTGVEHQLSLEEIGRRAIKIRDYNNKRVALKNLMADKLGQSDILEIKQDHLSE